MMFKWGAIVRSAVSKAVRVGGASATMQRGRKCLLVLESAYGMVFSIADAPYHAYGPGDGRGVCKGSQCQSWAVRVQGPCTACKSGIENCTDGRITTMRSRGGSCTHIVFLASACWPCSYLYPYPATAASAAGGTRSQV